MASERMQNADAAWLHMERPHNLLAVTALLWFDQPVDPQRLRERVQDRWLDRFPRFHQRPAVSAVPLAPARWEDDPSVDVDLQVHHRALPAPGDQSALRELVGDLMAAPLDRSKPLWQLHVVDGYGEGSAIVARIHHAMTDSLTVDRLLLSLVDDADGGTQAQPAPPRRDGDGALASLVKRSTAAASAAQGAAGALLDQGRGVLTDPSKLGRLAALARDDASALAKLLSERDPASVLRGEAGVARCVAWSPALPFDDVKAVARAASITPNDVLLAAVAGALHRYLERRDSVVERLRALVPFTLRPSDRPPPRRLGNRFGVVFLPLPVGPSDAGTRLEAVKREMEVVRSSATEGAIAYGLLTAPGTTVPQVEKLVVDRLAARASIVMTNIAGPRRPVRLTGATLRGQLVWAPCPGDLSTSVSIYSYAGEVVIGLCTDARVIPDPESITGELEDELEALGAVSP